MYQSTLAVLALMGLASAQNTTELFLVGFDQASRVGSIIGSDATATTYALACVDRNTCAPPTFTFTQGPSTVHFIYATNNTDIPNDLSIAETVDRGCQITNSESGTCSETTVATILKSIDIGTINSASSTISFSTIGSELNGVVVTITAGGVVSSANTAPSTSTTTSIYSIVSPTSSKLSATGSTSSSSSVNSAITALSTSATTSIYSIASPTSGKLSATGSTSSSVSKAAAPIMITQALWIVGGAAAALAFAAMS